MACQLARPDQDYGATRIPPTTSCPRAEAQLGVPWPSLTCLHERGRGARRRHLVCTRWALSPHRKEAIGSNTYPCGRNWEVSWTLRRTGDGGQRRPCLGVASRGTRGLAWLHNCKTSDLSPAGPHDASRIPFLRRLRSGNGQNARPSRHSRGSEAAANPLATNCGIIGSPLRPFSRSARLTYETADARQTARSRRLFTRTFCGNQRDGVTRLLAPGVSICNDVHKRAVVRAGEAARSRIERESSFRGTFLAFACSHGT